jgi:hypothetical protein
MSTSVMPPVVRPRTPTVATPSVAPPPAAPRPTSGPFIPEPTSPGDPSKVTNTAGYDPHMTYLLDKIRGRLDGDMGQDKATIAAGQRIGEFAQGQQGVARGNLARRGMLGNSGSEGEVGSEIGVAAGAQFSRAASEIAQDAERRRDAMLLGSGGIFSEPGRQSIADRGIGLSQWQAQSQAELARAQMEQQAKLQAQALAAQQQQNNFQNQLAAQELALRQQQAMWSMYSGGMSGMAPAGGGFTSLGGSAPPQLTAIGARR